MMYRFGDYWIKLATVTHTARHKERGVLVGFVGGHFLVQTVGSPEAADEMFFQLLDALGVGCDVVGHDPVAVEPLGGELGSKIYICSRCRETVDVTNDQG